MQDTSVLGSCFIQLVVLPDEGPITSVLGSCFIQLVVLPDEGPISSQYVAVSG